ncbi:MAG: hypothetical protein LBO64_10660 [Desulfovibrio sp.]|jgi:hypothetical protein|nr:hypothetical protein [Desulfovibrio sp.]
MFPHSDKLPSCRKARQQQRLAGKLCAFFLILASLGLIDGLQGVMRAGSDTLEILPGQSVMIAGSTAVKNPAVGDLQVSLVPDDGLLRFVFEGYFPSYWFGSGMWRGDVQSDALCPPGRYELTLRFRGSSARNAQKYTVIVWADENDMRAGSLFFTQRLFGINSFVPAGACVAIALLCGIATYSAGRRYFVILANMDCAEIFYVGSEKETLVLWCLADKKRPLPPGQMHAILAPDGRIIGQAAIAEQKKSTLLLHAPADTPVERDFLVYLRPLGHDTTT